MNGRAQDFRPPFVVTLAWGLVWACATPSVAQADPSQPPRTIFVMKLDGSQVRPLGDLGEFRTFRAPRWSHDGRRVALEAVGKTGHRVLIVAGDGTGVADLGPGGDPDWSPDDKQLAFSVADPAATHIWVQNVDGKGRGLLTAGTLARWSPLGDRMATSGEVLRILDLVDASRRDVPLEGVVRSFDFSPDGRELAVLIERSGERELLLATPGGAAPRLRLRGDLHSVAFSPDGKQLAVSLRRAQQPYQLYLLDVDPAGEPRLIAGQVGENVEPAFSPGAGQLAFASSRPVERPAAEPRERTGYELTLVRSWDRGGTVHCLAFTPDGRQALVGADMDRTRMAVWDVASGSAVREIDFRGLFVAVSPDGRHAACGEGKDRPEVRTLNLDDGQLVRRFSHGGEVMCVEYSRDGSRLASGGTDRTACVWEADTGEELARLKHGGAVVALAFSPDGKRLATACVDGTARVWNITGGKLLLELPHPSMPWCVAFTPDGRHLVTGTGNKPLGSVPRMFALPGLENAIRIWEVDTPKLVRQLNGHTHVVSSLALAPDGRQLLSSSFDGSLRLWDFETGAELARSVGQAWVWKVTFSPDGKRALAGGGRRYSQTATADWTDYEQERVRLFEIVRTSTANPG